MSDSTNLFRRALFRRIATLDGGPAVKEPQPPKDERQRRAETQHRALLRTQPTLPETIAEPVAYTPSLSPATLGKKRRCAVVVEDDHVIRAGIAAVLDDLGWRVVETPTLDGARLVLDALRPDVLVLDFNLSGEYASVLLDELRHMRRMGPTVIVSASPLAIDAARAHGLELLPKPFGIDDLIAVVERVSSLPSPSAR